MFTSYGDWNYALSFTTDYSGGTPLTDWNMLFRLSEDSSTGAGTAGFRYSQANANGGDLRFVSKAGEELKYEIANWNTAGESQVWVRVPSLASDENVTMYWGNTNAGLPAYCQQWIHLGWIFWGLPPRRHHWKRSGFEPHVQ